MAMTYNPKVNVRALNLETDPCAINPETAKLVSTSNETRLSLTLGLEPSVEVKTTLCKVN